MLVKSVEVKWSLKVWQNPSFRGLCNGRDIRESETSGKIPDSVRGLTRAQYPSRVNGKGYEGRLKAWASAKRIVEVKQTLKGKQK